LIFSTDNRCNIYSNAISDARGYGADIYNSSNTAINVIVDTFTVISPTDYYASPINNFTFDILHAVEELISADVYVAVNGDDLNSGTSVDAPFKTIKHALEMICMDSLNAYTIHLAEGVYSPNTNGETFPIMWSNNVNLSGSGEDEVILDASGTASVMKFRYVTNSTISNLTLTGGLYAFGGIYFDHSSPSLVNVTIANNTASYGGGGIFCDHSSPSLVNVTIANNTAFYGGGGIYCQNSSLSLVNCIMWNNSPQEVFLGGLYGYNNSITIAYSDIQGGETGIATNDLGTIYWLDGNIDADPLFVDAENGDYTLQQNSPCIDAGTAYFEWDGEVWVDMAEDEYYGIAPDMGCYEWEGVNTEDYELPVNNCQLTNQPNPFSNETTISFSLNTENTENAKIEIYNIRGQKVKTLFSGLVKSGQHEMVWNGTDANDKAVSSGVYFYKLKIGNKELTHKMMLIK